MPSSQVTVRRKGRAGDSSRFTDETAGVDPRPSAVRRGWSWRTAIVLRDDTAFWGPR